MNTYCDYGYSGFNYSDRKKEEQNKKAKQSFLKAKRKRKNKR